jgi:DNA repair exonuclease SbcCD ATPase subunit
MEYQPGLHFNSLTIQNGRVYQNETIPLARQGIVSVLGKNAVGKSTIFNLLQVPFFGSTPSGHKKNDLVKNDQDSSLLVNFDRGGTDYNLQLARQKKKWGYHITEKGIDITPHTFNDSVKRSAGLLGISPAEFEGSVHLTQGSQHILISGKPAKRKEYISSFFGIDTSYDQIQLAAKEELQKVKNEITKVSTLSHTKSVLEQEMSLVAYTDPEPVEKEIESYSGALTTLQTEIHSLNDALNQTILYEELWPIASITEDPAKDLKTLGKDLIRLKTELQMAAKIREENQNTREINRTISELTATVDDIEAKYSEIETVSVENLKKKYDKLVQLQYANEPLAPLRKELGLLQDIKELPIKEIEDELRKVQVDLLTRQRRLGAMEKGECAECGSKFDSTAIEQERSKVEDLQETFNVLSEDFDIVKARNKNAQRRQFLLQTIGNVGEFTLRDRTRLIELDGMMKAKADYDEAKKTLGILKPQKIQEEKDTVAIRLQIDETEAGICQLQESLKAHNKLPPKPAKTRDEISAQLADLKQAETQTYSDKYQAAQTLGEVIANNLRLKRLQGQLKDVVVKLLKLEDLKKDEFYWAKLAEAYGPKGLRVLQLQKMMDVVIRRLPVYTGILFEEKGLTFEHRCDANNVEILACREETSPDGTIKKFRHDISSFSGGEKGKMSTAFVLTLADCVPPAKRANILILDEVDSALDEDGQFRFTNDLLPMLRQNYESVFVVSHSQEIQQAAVYDQVWTVKKQNHWSTIDRVSL